MKSVVFALLTLGAITGCQPPPPQNPNTAPPGQTEQTNGSDQVCHEETPTGSNIPRTVCRPKDGADPSNAALKQQLSKPPGGATRPGG